MVTGKDGFAIMKIVDAARKSTLTGCKQKVAA